ncbi:MAG: zf-TFIIB domain-containing protein [Acidimicrobiales bacterium]|nr:zf-TFIIB domain-containing protein [Acidimicrobiales bacterium]
MQCPLCLNESLEAHIRGEIEIDVCPRCRGIWLDRGEIDKLAGGSQKIRRPRPDRQRGRSRDDDDRDDDERRYRERPSRDRKRRKKNFTKRLADVLEELID